MDNQSARLIIAIQLRDLDQLEEVGGLDKAVIAIQREQLKTDATTDHLALEASRRLASSMAKAIKEDSALLCQTTMSPQIDDATFQRLAALNQLPAPSADLTHSIPNLSPTTPPHLIRASQAVLSRVSSQQDAVAPVLPRKRSHSTDISVECLPRKKLQRHTHKAANNCDICPGTEATSPPNDVLTPTGCKPSSAAEDPLPQKAECASCTCEEIDQLIKASKPPMASLLAVARYRSHSTSLPTTSLVLCSTDTRRDRRKFETLRRCTAAFLHAVSELMRTRSKGSGQPALPARETRVPNAEAKCR
jgi:hypothetical protein